MGQRPVTKRDFPNFPMPKARGLLPFDYVAEPYEYRLLVQGKVPGSMDDMWFVYAERDWVYIHRSRSGFCIFQLRFEANANGYRVAEAWVNLDPSQNRLTEATEQAELISQATRLRRILYGKWWRH